MSVRIVRGDALSELRKLPAGSVHCCVTSPPYWGLRDYGTAKWEGGDPNCQHTGNVERLAPPGTEKQASNRGTVSVKSGDCDCGARRIDSQLGLESTPAEYVARMVEVFREVRRVLRDDGTLWLNLGDSYAGSSMSGGGKESSTLVGTHHEERDGARFDSSARKEHGLKPKDLVGIPWRVAFALQADGWYLRQDIIWSKPNPMPESVRDRCTKAHEYIFMLSKSERYYFDADSIAEPATGWNGSKFEDGKNLAVHPNVGKTRGKTAYAAASAGPNGSPQQDSYGGLCAAAETRNKRSVWTVATQPYSEAHFATFPPKLIEPCVLAGCPKGGTVLDPFGGAGTTGLVADRHGRNAILIELNPEYAAMAEKRIYSDAPLFADVSAA